MLQQFVQRLCVHLFAHNPPWPLVPSQTDELDVPHVVRVRPFEELEIRDELGLDPNALLHLRGGQSLTPSAALRFRQVRERAPLHD